MKPKDRNTTTRRPNTARPSGGKRTLQDTPGRRVSLDERARRNRMEGARPTTARPKERKRAPQSEQPQQRFAMSDLRNGWQRLKDIRSKPDLLLVEITLILLCIGLVMVLSASSYKALLEYNDAYHFFKRQIFFAILGIVVLFVMTIFNADIVRRFALPAFIVVCVLLVLVMLFGSEAKGATRWIEIAGVRFSPSDLAKPIGVVFFADYLERNRDGLRQAGVFVISAAVMSILPGMIIGEDLGTGTTLFLTLFAMMIVAGAPYRYAGATMMAGGVLGVIMIIIKPYRMQRITGFLSPFSATNMQGDGWQLVQSLYALGAGGFLGVGLGNSGQKMLYLPEMHTDFIFSVLAEELGFVGAGLVLALFVAFAWRGFWIAMHIRDTYKSLCAFGLTCVVVLQALINMGVAVGVLPITGITLPLISYGGTSLVVTLASIGYILNLSRYIEPRRKARERKQ